MSRNTITTSRTAIAAAGLGLALLVSIGGAGAAQAATPTSAACTAAKQQVGYAQSGLNEATATRTTAGRTVDQQKASRQKAIDAGNVEQVGQINVQLGSSTALFNTVDSSVASKQAQLVRAKAAQKAAC